MNPQDFQGELKRKQLALQKYYTTYFPVRAGNMALRFINGNFRAQGWQGGSFKRWKPIRRKGTILVKTGKLRAANYYTTQPGTAHLKNTRPYAAMHNNGFEGDIRIPEHKRRLLEDKKVGTGKFTKRGKERMKTVTSVKGITIVKSHVRHVKIAKRQFMPTSANDSPVLANALRREIEREIKSIFN